MTITELLADEQRLIAWLAYDGQVPMVVMPSTQRYAQYCGKPAECKPVTDKETLAQWREDYRRQLAADWAKQCPWRFTTWSAFLADCARSLGFKGKTHAEKINACRAHVRAMTERLEAV